MASIGGIQIPGTSSDGSDQGTTLGGALGGPVGFMFGAQYDAGQAAARAQGRFAEAQLAEARATRAAATSAAEMSDMELAQLERAIALNERDVARREQLLASADPAMIEAGTQALQLLQGKEASVLAPIRNQRAKERLQLENKLRSQLGSGYANSTAGIQALSAFDEATAAALAGAQQQTLSQLLGFTQPISQQGLTNQSAQAGNIAQARGNVNVRQANAILGTPTTQYAGAQFAGQIAQNNATQNFIGGLANLGISAAGLAAGNPFAAKGAAAPTSNTGYGGGYGSNTAGAY